MSKVGMNMTVGRFIATHSLSGIKAQSQVKENSKGFLGEVNSARILPSANVQEQNVSGEDSLSRET